MSKAKVISLDAYRRRKEEEKEVLFTQDDFDLWLLDIVNDVNYLMLVLDSMKKDTEDSNVKGD